MTPKQKQITIAKALGFTRIRKSKRWEVTDPPEPPVVLLGTINQVSGLIPDYPKDASASVHICEVLAERGWKIVIRPYADGSWDCSLTKGRNGAYAEGKSLPEAVATAFLTILDEDQKSRP